MELSRNGMYPMQRGWFDPYMAQARSDVRAYEHLSRELVVELALSVGSDSLSGWRFEDGSVAVYRDVFNKLSLEPGDKFFSRRNTTQRVAESLVAPVRT